MTKEDYFKYYIQGSDHYLIPKDVFNELFNEMSNWKEEAKELKKQLTTYQILHRDCKVDNLKNISKIEEMENQQKEFIDYMENKIYSIEPKGTGINYNCEYDSEEDYLNAMEEQSKLNTFKEILSKYQEIIGVSDENTKD